MGDYSNKQIRERINELTLKKQTLIGKKEALLNQYIELCQDIDREDLIKIDKQLLQEEITTNELHMKNLISKIEDTLPPYLEGTPPLYNFKSFTASGLNTDRKPKRCDEL